MPGVITITYGFDTVAVEKTAAAWGANAAPKIQTRDRMPTKFTFKLAGLAPESGTPFKYFPEQQRAGLSPAQAEAACRVVIKQYSKWTGGKNWSGLLWQFVGYLSEQPANVSGKSQHIQVEFSDPIWLLQNTTFQQLWNLASTPGAPVYVSRAVLFMDINSWVPNQYMSVQWQLNQIIAFAAGCGIRIAAGTIDYSGWFLNYVHTQSVSCWDAILTCLKPIPNAKVWVDGSTAVPTLNIRTRANIAAMATPAGTGPGPITLPYRGRDARCVHDSSHNFQARHDLVPPQVLLQYQINNTYDSKPAPKWFNDVYPPAVGSVMDGRMPFAMVCPIDLTGSAVTVDTGVMDSEPLKCVGGSHAQKRAWWGSKRGGEHHKLSNADGSPNYQVRFQDKDFNLTALGDATITDDAGNAVDLGQYPNRHVRGTFHKWMTLPGTSTPVKCLRVKIKVKASLSHYDTAGSGETDSAGNRLRLATAEDFSFSATLTNAPAGVTNFVGQQPTAMAETPVQNLAQNIYNARKDLDYDGEHEITDPGLPDGSRVPLQQIIGHWNVINFSGGKPEWANANMTIAGTDIDLVTNHVAITVGPAKHLSPQDWSEMLQFFRYRYLYGASEVRATGYGSAGNTVDMAANTPDGNTVPGLAVDSAQCVIGVDNVDATRTNRLQQNSATGQANIIQQDSSSNAVLTSSLVMAEFTGSGAPGPATLA